MPLMSGALSTTVSEAYNSGFNWQAGDLPPEQSSFNVVNARIAWTDPTGRYTFSTWAPNLTDDRKRVVPGQSVAVRVDHGGRRVLKNKKQETIDKSESTI